jgi:hypothetical protein
MLTPKENFLLATVKHKVPEWIPNEWTDVYPAGGSFETFENGPTGGGMDGFNVLWHTSQSAASQAVPAVVKNHVLEDITLWEDIVKFPNLDAFDWQGAADFQLANTNRELKAVEYGCWNAQFLRLTHLMGFENALCAMYEEPDVCFALLSAVTDYKIKLAEKIAKYFRPDILTTFIDVATERGLFMSPSMYRELISPQHKRLNEAIESLNMIPFVHCCGKCEEIIPDFIDEGYVAWSAAQPMNDIVGIQAKYGDKISIIGGYNSNGRPGMPDVTEEEIDKEVKRSIETYGPQGSYAFMGFRLVNSPDPMAFFAALGPINAAHDKYKYLAR